MEQPEWNEAVCRKKNLTPGNEKIVYVSAAASGSTPDGSIENPYGNIKDAFEAVEALSDADVKKRDYVISLSEGDYLLNETLRINAFNKYKNVTSVTLEGIGNTSIKSGKTVSETAFNRVTDTEILNRVPANARGSIYAANVGSGMSGLEVSAAGKIMRAARYPNKGYLQINNADGTNFTALEAERWNTATDMYVYYMPNYFSYAYPASASGTTVTVTTSRTVADSKEYYVYNLLEELDVAGEYFYDRESGMLYTYGKQTVEIFSGANKLLELLYFNNLTIDNITFENAGDTLVKLEECENTVIKNSTLRNGSNNAVVITRGHNTGLVNCNIYAMGNGGVNMSGGDRQTLAPGNNYIDNCSIHDCQRLDRSYKALVSISGVGNSLTNSDIYNSYHQAITIYGNDLKIKDNKIYNVCNETSDMGVIYAEGDWTMRGTVIEHNYFADIPKKGTMGAFAIYIDNGLSGVTVKNNIFTNIDRQAVYINGGRNNTVTNNIFVNTGNIGSVSDILNWGGNPTIKDTMLTKLNAVPYQGEAYSKYANLADILNDEPLIPKYNKFTKNVRVNSEDLKDAWLHIPRSELEEIYGCEFNSYVLDENDLTNYAAGDYTLKVDAAAEIGFETFTNRFGRQ